MTAYSHVSLCTQFASRTCRSILVGMTSSWALLVGCDKVWGAALASEASCSCQASFFCCQGGMHTFHACLLAHAGKDATQDYEEIGHSKAAHALLAKYSIGDYEVMRG